MEYHEGGLRAETKVTFGDLIGRLYDLWRYTAGHISFDDVARHYGKLALRERLGPDASKRVSLASNCSLNTGMNVSHSRDRGGAAAEAAKSS